MKEQSIIKRYFAPLTGGKEEAYGLLNDAAILPVISGKKQVCTMDTMTENVHFFSGVEPSLLAQKLLRVNLSDIASMGAVPTCYFLSLALPKATQESWIAAFTEGLAKDNAAFSVYLLGGDTVVHEGLVTATITAIGEMQEGEPLTRSGAKAGDILYVSGNVGDMAAGLEVMRGNGEALSDTAKKYLTERYHLPTPRLRLGQLLSRYASAAMDVSDGLFIDATRLAAASHVCLTIEKQHLPLSPALQEMLATYPDQEELLLNGGDDYELLFTVPADKQEAFKKEVSGAEVQVTEIGRVLSGEGSLSLKDNGAPWALRVMGYDHFGT